MTIFGACGAGRGRGGVVSGVVVSIAVVGIAVVGTGAVGIALDTVVVGIVVGIVVDIVAVGKAVACCTQGLGRTLLPLRHIRYDPPANLRTARSQMTSCARRQRPLRGSCGVGCTAGGERSVAGCVERCATGNVVENRVENRVESMTESMTGMVGTVTGPADPQRRLHD